MKTTHFHCNRSGCGFNFKNKADMEKHKNYHMKDEQLNKDGFKKFAKHDECGFEGNGTGLCRRRRCRCCCPRNICRFSAWHSFFDKDLHLWQVQFKQCEATHVPPPLLIAGCRFSKSVNHIHCIRSGCDYVLHSSGQLYSHKRKHERRDSQEAYRKYRMAATALAEANGGPAGEAAAAAAAAAAADLMRPPSSGSLSSEASSSTPPLFAGSVRPTDLPPVTRLEPLGSKVPEDAWREYMLHFEAGEGCGFQVGEKACELEEQAHFHCKDDGCEAVFPALTPDSVDAAVREHGKNHFLQDQVTEKYFAKSDPEDLLEATSSVPPPEKIAASGSGNPDGANGIVTLSCTEVCPHRRTQLHYHCQWVSEKVSQTETQ